MPKAFRVIFLGIAFITVSALSFSLFWYLDSRAVKQPAEKKTESPAVAEDTSENEDLASQAELATSTDSTTASTTPAEQSPEDMFTSTTTNTGPEIPVEQYWAFGNLNGLKLYVNNTDRNVIYALDDKGKIIWQIWGKDFGFEKFEIRLKNERLFVSAAVNGARYPTRGLWVIDGDGKLAWKYEFYGYLDMPEMIITDSNLVLLENRYSQPAPGGNVLRAFDIVTGKIAWSHGPKDFYGHYNFLQDNGNIFSKSGGLGSGRFTHQYELNAKTGAILSHKIIVDDNEKAALNHTNLIQTYKQLIFDVLAKKISLVKYSDVNQIYWTLSEDSELYKLVVAHQTDNLRIAILGSIIHTEEQGATSSVSHVFSLGNGAFMWKKDFSSDKLDGIMQVWEVGGTLGIRLDHRTSCSEFCDTCPEGQMVCVDEGPSAECSVCRQNEETAVGYVETGIRTFNVGTGDLLWEYASKTDSFWVSAISAGKSTVSVSLSDTKTITLDAKTGKVK